jgi:hypothetical protein
MRSFRALLIWSAVLAVLSKYIPTLLMFLLRGRNFGLVLLAGSFFSMLWIAVVIYALKTLGRRGLWLLLGLPLSMSWPLSVLFIWASCRFGHDCM